MLHKFKKLIPDFLLRFYHKTLAVLAPVFYGFPGSKMIVVGVTGTRGKTTVVNLAAKVLEEAGYKVGFVSTANYKTGDEAQINPWHITMPGRLKLQKMLKEMKKRGAQYAIIETSSQGITQYRHLGINYDILVYTGLYPEHIEAHGGFENYRAAKMMLFEKMQTDRLKKLNSQIVKKTTVLNVDDDNVAYFLKYKAAQKYGYKIEDKALPIGNFTGVEIVQAKHIEESLTGTKFQVEKREFNLKLLGRFNAANALAAAAVGLSQGLDWPVIKAALEKAENIPGRLELINEGQDFKVMVDYAHDPVAIRKLYDFLGNIGFRNSGKKIIHILGSAGGGRDKAKRPVMGELAGEKADIVIVTDEDPYDEDPLRIIDEVLRGVLAAGKKLDHDVFRIPSRRQAIETAMGMAKAGDLVMITGKGAEQCIMEGDKKVPWDDRRVAGEALRAYVENVKNSENS